MAAAGDIQAIATGSNRVYTCGADGSLRSWTIGKGGELSESTAREKAHGDRATALVYHKNVLFSASYDGCVKAWNAETLELLMEARAAHDGQRIYCAAIGPDGVRSGHAARLCACVHVFAPRAMGGGGAAVWQRMYRAAIGPDGVLGVTAT